MGNGKRRVRELRMIEKESYRALLLTERGGPAWRIRLQPIRMGDIFRQKWRIFPFLSKFLERIVESHVKFRLEFSVCLW